MLVSMQRAWWGSLLAGLSVAGVVAVYLLVRSGLNEAVEAWDQVLLAGCLGALATIGAYAAAYLRYRRALHQLGGQLAQFRQKPATSSLRIGPDEELAPLLEPVEILCAAYRQVLADRVAQDQALEAARLLLGKLDSDKGQRLTVRGSGSSRNMVARLTPNLFWMTATPALQQFLHCKMADLNGRPFAEMVHPQDMPSLERIFHEALETGEVHHAGLRLLPRDQTGAPRNNLQEYHVTLDVLTRYTEDGKVQHFRCFFVDVSDRVRAEQELRRRTQELSQTNERLRRINQDLERLKESYRDLYHHAPVMFFSLDPQGRFVTFNETLVRILGYQREDLWKQPYTRLLPPQPCPPGDQVNGNQAGRNFLPPALAREGEVETQWVKKDGTIIDVWIRSVPVQDENGLFVRSRSAAQDVTERNRLANELRARRDELERANADLRLINRELEEFTSVVSHDLKEPLRTLQAFSNFLAEDFSGQLGPDGFQYINHLVQASRRLGTLIDDLLKLSWAGRITHDVEVFNLIEIVATVRRDLAGLLQRRQADLIVDGGLPYLIGDPQRITQLLANLVGNALKYNQSANPRVVVGQIVPEDEKNGQLPPSGVDGKKRIDMATVYVRDNGIGIDPRYHEQIFGIFRRLHQSEEYEGTGAGLAICKKIVEAHTGKIWVESTPGQGATFYFTLPRDLRDTPQESLPLEEKKEPGPSEEAAFPSLEDRSPTPPLPADQGMDGGKEEEVPLSFSLPEERLPHLLLVEDMAEIGLIAQKLSQRGGQRLTWVRTAEEALANLQTDRPDLVLVDIHLPGMNGLELCRRLRGREDLKDLPIALFTQGTELPSGSEGAGADFVLSKDLLCRPEAWLKRLSEMLQAIKKTADTADVDCQL